MTTEDLLFRRGELCKITGLSARQVQYWHKTNLIRPSYQTPGSHGRYTFQDLIAFKAAKKLLDAGVSLQKIRKSIASIREVLPSVKRPLAELALVATGDVILVFYQDSAFEAISGQEWIIEIAEIEREVLRWKDREERLGKYRRLNTVAASKDRLRKTA